MLTINLSFLTQKKKTLPTLLFDEFTKKASKIIVDMGAIPYVCKGATVMAPGIVRIEGEWAIWFLLLMKNMEKL